MFRALHAHHQEVELYWCSIWYRPLSQWPSGAPDGHRFAIRILRVLMSALFIHTVEISPLACLYSACPPVPCIISCAPSVSVIFIYTCLMPSIYIMFTFFSGIRSMSWIQSWILRAEILGLSGSKVQPIVFRRSPMLTSCFPLYFFSKITQG
jgi:hypothetical protein